jgi:hypothetical protein
MAKTSFNGRRMAHRNSLWRSWKPTFGRACITFLAMTLWLSSVDFAVAHHILGRPSDSLNADSNTPPGMHVETQIGDYLVTYMAFPDFPQPGKPGRINLYATRIDDGTPFPGEITFKLRHEPWYSWLGLGGGEEQLGLQSPDDNVFYQRLLFTEAGDYIVTAQFEAGGEPYAIDFPLRVGDPLPVGPIGMAVSLLALALVAVSVIQRRRAMTGKLRIARDEQSDGAAPRGGDGTSGLL